MIIVDDTGAIISGLPFRLPGQHYTTTLVVKEIIDAESRDLLNRAVDIGRLQVKDPSGKSVRQAEFIAKKASIHRKLSKTDLSVLALALELAGESARVLVATDDYALQVAVRSAGLDFIRIRYRGIR
jgi:rRNA maturation endonuclease Nob1